MELIHALFHSSQRGPLTLQGIKELANIHYWAVSIIPVLLGSALAYTVGNKFDLLVFVLLLPAAISMHCVVNAYNHLFDYLRGTDRGEEKNSSRYPILYYGINPLYVLILGVVYLFLAFVLSFYVVLQAGWPLLMRCGGIYCGILLRRPIPPGTLSFRGICQRHGHGRADSFCGILWYDRFS